MSRFEIDPSKDTLLLFQENQDKPVATLAMNDLPTSTILEVGYMQHGFGFGKVRGSEGTFFPK